MLEDILDPAFEEFAEALQCGEVDALRALVVERGQRVPMQAGCFGDMRELHLAGAHQGRKVAADHASHSFCTDW